jgi:hypothetical protein
MCLLAWANILKKKHESFNISFHKKFRKYRYYRKDQNLNVRSLKFIWMMYENSVHTSQKTLRLSYKDQVFNAL